MGNDLFINSIPNLNIVTNLLQLELLMFQLVHTHKKYSRPSTQLRNSQQACEHNEKRIVHQALACVETVIAFPLDAQN
jgi:hypothetical protein